MPSARFTRVSAFVGVGCEHDAEPMTTPFQSADVEAVFEAYPHAFRVPLLRLRDLIFEVAETTDGVGPLVEALRWSQPSYLTEASGSGTTVRIDRFGEHAIAVLVHCQTTLVETFRDLVPELEYHERRAIVLDPAEPLPVGPLSVCIELALTYKRRKRRAVSG